MKSGAWCLAALCAVAAAVQPVWAVSKVLGTENGSDAEFQQGGYLYQAINLDIQGVAAVPKEVNDSFWPATYFYFNLTGAWQTDSYNAVVLTLNPVWNDGTGTLKVAVDSWVNDGWYNGGVWAQLGTVDINAQANGTVAIPRNRVPVGSRWDFRIRAAGGASGTHVVTWDQIRIEGQTRDTNSIKAATLGVDNGSDAEFQQGGFQLTSFDVDAQPVAQFPKEVNDAWWQNQYFNTWLNLGEADQDLAVTLDAAWSDGSGALNVALDRWNPAVWGWEQVGVAAMSGGNAKVVSVPQSKVVMGRNDYRLRYAGGTNGTHVVTWDQLRLAGRSRSARFFAPLGYDNSTDSDFLQTPYTNYIPVEIVDGQSAYASYLAYYGPGFPKEINDSFWPQQYFWLWMNAAQKSRPLCIAMDPFWSDGSGTVAVATDVWNPSASAWQAVATSQLRGGVAATVVVPTNRLLAGRNDFRFRSLGGVGGTHVVTWDSLLFQSQVATTTMGTAIFPTNKIGCTLAVGEVSTNAGGEMVLGSEAGIQGTVKVTTRTGAQISSFVAFTGYVQGVSVAVGEVASNNPLREIIVAPSGTNASSQVKVFSAAGSLLRTINVPGGGNGMGVAAGDVDGNGSQEIVVNNGSWTVLVYRADGTLQSSFSTYARFPYEGRYVPSYDYPHVSKHVAAGDVNGDGKAEIIFPLGRHYIVPLSLYGDNYEVVRIYDGAGTALSVIQVASFGYTMSSPAPGSIGSVSAAVGDLDGDGRAEIVTGGDHLFMGSTVRAFTPNTTSGQQVAQVKPYTQGGIGANVAVGDLDGDGKPEIVTAPSRINVEERVKVFKP